MDSKIRYLVIIGISIILVFSFYNIKKVYSDDDNGDETERGSDLAKAFGSIAIGFLSLGAIFVILKRTQVVSKLYLKKYEEYEEVRLLREYISLAYRKYRKPAFYLHAISTLLATIFAALHGWFMELRSDGVTYAGGVAVVSMIIMSISGIIMWLKFWPLWDFEGTKTMIKWIHRQWFFTGLMIVGILIHFAFGD